MHNQPNKITTFTGPAHIKDIKKLQEKPIRRNITHYAIKPSKPNLLEIQRNLNKRKLKNTKKTKHSENLYALNRPKQEVRNMMATNNIENQIQQDYSHPYHPYLTDKSLRLMESADQDVIGRTEQWKAQREDKKLNKRAEKEQYEYQRDLEATFRPEYKKANIPVDSKVRQILDTTSNLKRNRSNSIKYKEGNFKNVGPKGYATLRLDRSRDNSWLIREEP